MCETETMFSILTYEPFEKITGDEKKYIEAVLNDDSKGQQGYPLYDELMKAFKVCKDTKDSIALEQWYEKHYTTKAVGKIKVLWSKDKDERTYYPVLFKKICYCCLTEYGFLDAEFMGQFGISVGIINKWRISPRYGRMINKDTYSAIRLKRNGRKIEYLTKVIKAIYYEACRQVIESEKGWMSAKKENLMAFVDVFAGTGTVTASVDAPWSIVNDKELGAACFLYCMSDDKKRVMEMLASLHNNFVSGDLDKNKKCYDMQKWQEHKKKLKQYSAINDPEFDTIMVRLRKNYEVIHEIYQACLEKCYNIDFKIGMPSDEKEAVYDVGIAWYFLNSFTGFYGSYKHAKTDMDVWKYYSYLRSGLNVFKGTKKDKIKHQKLFKKYGKHNKYKIISEVKLNASDIKFIDGKKFMNSLESTKIFKEEFDTFLEDTLESYLDIVLPDVKPYVNECFIYLDSPYFMTSQYDVVFYDEEHKKMLDILRDHEWKWLFSMQYYTGETTKVKSVSRKKFKNNSHLIKDYDTYYKGFINEFKVDESGYWVVDDTLDKKKLDSLYVIFFRDTKSNEMMICNFDARPAIKYDSGTVIFPMSEFIEFEKKGMTYQDIYDKAVLWRKEYIIANFYLGGCV